jgi:hypothetical protein
MKPGQRIELITRCANSLANRGWNDIDFYLSQFHLPTSDIWNDRSEATEFNYVRAMLGAQGVSDEDLAALDDFLHGPAIHSADDEPWTRGNLFRVFISHLAAHRETATRLKASLEWWGFDSFIAHKDINPGKEWLDVIVAALHSCDALVGLVHTGFRDSEWCDQEVGFALGRAIPTIPIRVDADPHGFFGHIQAISWPHIDKPEAEVASNILDVLINDKRTTAKVTEAIVATLVNAKSFDHANALVRVLLNSSTLLSSDQLQRLRKAQSENGQVGGAWHVENALQSLESRTGKTDIVAETDLDDEPF